MRINFVEIQNFRKLQSCRIDFGQEQTVLVGANNSGKTSAMQALIKFLGTAEKSENVKNFVLADFTASTWKIIKEIEECWTSTCSTSSSVDLCEKKWSSILPCLDIWLSVDETELQFVSEFIPTLDWQGGNLGIRLVLEPVHKEKGIETLYRDFKKEYDSVKLIKESNAKKDVKLWPETLCDFLNGRKESKLQLYFKVAVYILDPERLKEPDKNTNIAHPQETPQNLEAIDRKALNSIFRVDIIPAQRGFSDTSETENQLSNEFRYYYDQHLDLEDMPDPSDIDAISSVQQAQNIFDSKLQESFKEPLEELAQLGYPGFDNPKPTIATKILPQDGLTHSSIVEHSLCSGEAIMLPESYNGLGYQNLIYMAFKMMSFRDEWMRKGKMGKRPKIMEKTIPRLHIVLIEEPEAHLHTQVQQVFIKKAYETLRNHDILGNKNDFSTQLVISTHSNHIVAGADFTNLRYFHRLQAGATIEVPISTVISMANTFKEKNKKNQLSDEDKTKRFATRYIRTTHCDLFFADAIILVEGSAERIMLPYFIKNEFKVLDRSYISILEVGGSHAHRLKPLIEKLGIPCLIITDLDAGENGGHHKSVMPKKGQSYITNNDTLKIWLPKEQTLDELLNKTYTDKVEKSPITNQDVIRVAYQFSLDVNIGAKQEEYIPYTFEDAFVCTNLELFEKSNEDGAIGKFREAILTAVSADDLANKFFSIIQGKVSSKGNRSGGLNKGEFILDVVNSDFFEDLVAPKYIKEGLDWLQSKVNNLQTSIINI